MSETPGFDFAWTKPDPTAAFRCGYRFALGYVSNDPSKNLSQAQVAAYRAAGLQVGLVWELYVSRALEGYQTGHADGVEARRQARAVGYPDSCVVFTAVDSDYDPAAVSPYVKGFRDGAGVAGVYGSFRVIEALVPAVVPYGWQTAAWSGGELSDKAHLYQRAGHPNWPVIPGVSANAFDENVLCIPLPLLGAQGDDMPLTPTDISAVASRVLDIDLGGGSLSDFIRAARDQDLLNKVNNVYAAIFNGGPSMPDGKSINDLLSEILAAQSPQAVADAVAKLPAADAQQVAQLVLAGLDGSKITVAGGGQPASS